MRTTLNIDDDLLGAAKAMARAKAVSVGEIVSELIRKGLAQRRHENERNGLPLFTVHEEAHPITINEVKKLEDLE